MNIVKILKYQGGTPTARLFEHIPWVKDLRIYRRVKVCSCGNFTLYVWWCDGIISDFYTSNVIETERGVFVAGFGSITDGKKYLKRWLHAGRTEQKWKSQESSNTLEEPQLHD